MKNFYITTPLYYVNDKPHIGHAYTTIAADVLARWQRQQGVAVTLLTGTDEHGSKIAQAAEKAGISPQAFTDKLVPAFKDLWQILNIRYDDFIRTTEERHIRSVGALFEALRAKGDIYEGQYEGWYCVACESFWTESQLVDKNCPDCKRDVQKLQESSWFFKLSKYEQPLLDYYKQHPDFLSPTKRGNEMIRFVESGLKDVSVSRVNERWGIPVPFAREHTVYVWFDALLNYATAAGYPDAMDSKKMWPADVHLVGKEIFRFHTILWPAMLMALEIELPRKVFAHGWWTVEGEKMSKSRGNVVDPIALSQEYGADAFRYFLLREIPFGADGDFSYASLKARYNTELANDLGNLFSRALNLIEKNMDGTVRTIPKELFVNLKEADQKIKEAYAHLAFDQVLDVLGAVVRESNAYLEKNAPWKLAKTDPTACAGVLSNIYGILLWLAAGYAPFMPEKCATMAGQLGLDAALPEIITHPAEWIHTLSLPRKISRAILFPRKE